jgi:hypothetical protein
MLGKLSRRFCISFCLTATMLLLWNADAARSTTRMDQIKETIMRVRTGGTVDARTDAAEHLAQLARKADPKVVDDETINEMISLLDSPDDSVRAWVAAALGYLGPRAKSAIPKLLSILPLSDCLTVSLSSAPAIRLAITRMGETPPPPPNCGGSRR